MADPAALAFSHILARNLEEGIVRTFIGDDPKARLRFLAEDVLPSLPSLSDSLLEAISVDDRFRLNLNWFKSDKTAEWVKEGTPTKLLLLAETVPNAPLTKEKYIDLLTFPNKEIKNTAINIVHGLTKLNVEFLNFLASPTSKLNRSQLIFLITALSTPGKTGEVATSRWFKLTPDPGTVANFLNISPTKKSELFNVQVVSYLKDSRWAPTLDVLKQLILHREPLIRALAYTRFDLSHETHRDLIEKMSVIDPDPRLRKSLVDQLSIPQPEDEHFTSIRQ